jgi:hypothetical protein
MFLNFDSKPCKLSEVSMLSTREHLHRCSVCDSRQQNLLYLTFQTRDHMIMYVCVLLQLQATYFVVPKCITLFGLPKGLFFFITLNLLSSQRKLLWLEILCSHFHWKVQPVNLEMLYYHHHRKCIMKKMSSISNNWLNPQPLRWWAWM